MIRMQCEIQCYKMEVNELDDTCGMQGKNKKCKQQFGGKT
jgi:hypothetical protein